MCIHLNEKTNIDKLEVGEIYQLEAKWNVKTYCLIVVFANQLGFAKNAAPSQFIEMSTNYNGLDIKLISEKTWANRRTMQDALVTKGYINANVTFIIGQAQSPNRYNIEDFPENCGEALWIETDSNCTEYVHANYAFIVEQRKRKGILLQCLNDPNIHLSDIRWTRSHHLGEFQVETDRRIFDVDDTRLVNFGALDGEWYSENEYWDFGNYRVSQHYYMYPDSFQKSWILDIASVDVYEWEDCITEYDPMTDEEIAVIAKEYVDKYISAGKPGNGNVDIVEKMIRHEFHKRFHKFEFGKED